MDKGDRLLTCVGLRSVIFSNLAFYESEEFIKILKRSFLKNPNLTADYL